MNLTMKLKYYSILLSQYTVVRITRTYVNTTVVMIYFTLCAPYCYNFVAKCVKMECLS